MGRNINQSRQKIQILGIALALLVFGTISLLFWGSKKQVWFCDEIYSYQSANGFEQDWPATYVDEWMTGTEVEAFFAADGDRLDLNAITVRLYNDHVPLYFWLFRIVSFFFFKGSGSIWIGLSINLFFYLFLLETIYFLFLRLVKSPVLSGIVVVLSFIFNRLVIEQATFLRMYMMLLWAQVLLLFAGMWVLESVWKNKLSPLSFIGLYLISVIGFLIHYDFWVFYAVTAAFCCMWLLVMAVKRRGKLFWRSMEFGCVLIWCADFALALFSTILIFPYCRWNLNSGKGQTALHSLFDFSTTKLKQIIWGYERLSGIVFGESVPVAAGLLLMFGCIIGGGILLYKNKEKKQLTGLVLTVLIAQGYQLAVCFTMPAGWEERYLWGTFTLMMLCMVWGGILLLRFGFSKINEDRIRRLGIYATGVILSACIFTGELIIIDSGRGIAYLFQEEKDVDVLKANADIPWIVYGPAIEGFSAIGVYSYYDWLIPEKICFLTTEDTIEDRWAIKELQGENRFILYLYEEYFPHALELFEQELGRELEGKYLFPSTYLSVYLIESQPDGD